MFDFSGIVSDLVSKWLQILGGSAIATGYVTTNEWTAIGGGLAALVGVGMNAYKSRQTRKNVAVVAEAVDDKKTTTAAINSAKPLVLPTDKKNLASA